MGVAYPFGLPGRARGVNHVRQVVAVQVQTRRVTGPTLKCEAVHRNRADALHARQARQQMTLGQQQGGTTVLQHVPQAFWRVVRVQRHISAAGLDNRQ